MFVLSFICIFFLLSTFLGFSFFNKIYGHGLSRDESLPFDVSGRKVTVEGMLEPPILNEGKQESIFMVRAHDEKTNETIADINYHIIVKFKNETILDQRFHSFDGIILANLIPSDDSSIHQIINKEQEQEQNHLSKNNQVKIGLKNPITIKSKILKDGGLYDISVILEKSSKGLNLDSDKKIELFISIGKTIPFVIKKTFHSTETSNTSNEVVNKNGEIILKVKTFYDDVTDFRYELHNSKISFKMPFRWNVDYVSQVVNLHMEIIIPKSYEPLSKVSSFSGSLNGMEIQRNTILIDDYSNPDNRIVHIIVPNFKLKEFTEQIINNGGDSYASFEIVPIEII